MKKKVKIVSAIFDVQSGLVKCTRFMIMLFLLGSFLAGTIVFSFIGMQTVEVPFNGSGTYNAIMKFGLVDLDEVVVVGYGTQKRRNVTGAVETINPEEVANLPVGNLGAALV